MVSDSTEVGLSTSMVVSTVLWSVDVASEPEVVGGVVGGSVVGLEVSGCVVVEGEGDAMVALPAHLRVSTACTGQNWSGRIMYVSSSTRDSDWLGAVKLPFTTI